jgi:ATP-binding cassette subfamily B protein
MLKGICPAQRCTLGHIPIFCTEGFHTVVSSSPKAPQADARWLWGFVLRRKGYAVGSVVTGILGGVSVAVEPFLVGTIIDHVREDAPLSVLLTDAALILFFGALTVVSFYVQRWYSGQVAYSVSYDIRQMLFDNLLAMQPGFYARYAPGDLLARMQGDMDMIWRLLVIAFLRFSGSITVLAVTFALLASVNLLLTFVVFVVLVVSTGFQLWAGAALAPVFEKVQDQGGVMAARVQDAVSGISTIRTFGAERAFAAEYAAANLEFRDRWIGFKRRNEPVGMLPNMISQLTTGIVVLFGGILTLNGEMSLGNFAQFLIYLGLISSVLLNLGAIYQRYQQTRGALYRFNALVQMPTIADAPDPVPIEPPRTVDIRFEGVSLVLDGTDVLRDISLHIPAGEIVGIVGATGSSKTMLVNLLARLYDPTEGRVLLNGIDARRWPLKTLRAAFAYVPQQTFLFSQTLEDNVRMGRAAAETGREGAGRDQAGHLPPLSPESLDRILQIARVSNDLTQLPDGLNTLVGEKGVLLSGGQKQRVAIARAIAQDPAVLILDDALSSVDTATAADILHDLREVFSTRTSLIIAQRMATVRECDRILVMREGRIVEQGRYADLIAAGGAFAAMAAREQAEGLHGETGDLEARLNAAGGR